MIQDLKALAGEMVLEKRRFSAFFKTDLDQTLRTLGLDTVVVAGISTHVCVLMTCMDALSHDFHSIIIEDCCAAHTKDVHRAALELYRRSAFYPLLRILTLAQFRRE